MRKWLLWAVIGLLSFSASGQPAPPPQGGLSASTFAQPPARYGIRCWWWWLNGNVTKAAITRDLEAMQAKGFSGACLFDAGGAEQRGNGQIPEGPLFGSPAWRELYKHAVQEAHRLNLELSLSIQSGWNLGGPDVTPEEATKQLTWSEQTLTGPMTFRQALPLPKHRDNFYRDLYVLAFPKPKSTPAPIRDLAAKSGAVELGGSAPDSRFLLTDVPPTPGEMGITKKEVLNLTKRLLPDGTLEWTVPPGEWTVMRFGYTYTGAEVSTSSGGWQGRVLDHLSEQALTRYWNTHVEPLLQMIGPLAGKTLKYLHTDSWEGGGCNWTDTFANEFKRRRGYDLVSYLPVITGKIVGSRDESTRFLADFRKTIGDLVADNHYAVFARLSSRHGIGLQPESAGPHAGPFDGIKNYGFSDIMMSEFWSPSPHRPLPHNRFFVKQASSAAHIYNKRLVGAESFTTIGPHWNDVIWRDMKSSADHEFCAGLNLVYLHTFTCSPAEMGLPGQEYFAGTHFNPNVTWWHLAGGFIDYLRRCHYVLQQGQSVADVLYYYGDHVPNIARQKADDPAQALPAFDYDVINEDRLLVLQVQNGLIRLPHGLTYRVLVLPDHAVLSLKALHKVAQLVHDGATVIGPRTNSTASLVRLPTAEAQRQQVANTLWGEQPANGSGQRQVGKGRIIWGKTAREVLLADGLLPDAQLVGRDPNQTFDYVHRTADGADIYFISNQNPVATTVQGTFRVAGRQPELWDAVTGQVRPATAFKQAGKTTQLTLDLPPYGSVFVVFRKPISVSQQGIDFTATPGHRPISTLTGPWQVSFDPKWISSGRATVSFDTLADWTSRPEEGVRFYSGAAIYRKTFDWKGGRTDSLWLDLGQVLDVGVARVRLNGTDLGTVWTPPFRVPVGGFIQPVGNKLEVEVVNSWRNRLIGDREKPKAQRLTQTNVTIKPDWKLQPSGLLGPVQLLAPTPRANATTYLARVVNELEKQWPQNRTINLVFHGHSVPAGYGQTPAVHTLESYPQQLLTELKKRYPYAVINVIVTAIGGENSLKGEARFTNEVLPHKPDVLFIDYALNDRFADIGQVRGAWENMIQAAQQQGIPVILVTPSPDQRLNISDPNNPLEPYVRQINELAAHYQVGLADPYTYFKKIAAQGQLPSVMAYINHPNQAGHQLIAQELLRWFR